MGTRILNNHLKNIFYAIALQKRLKVRPNKLMRRNKKKQVIAKKVTININILKLKLKIYLLLVKSQVSSCRFYIAGYGAKIYWEMF